MDEETKGQKRTTRQHQVYALVDPRDKKVRYIGISINPYTRLLHHLNEIENVKRAWLTELKQLGLSPDLEILETIENIQDADIIALDREKHWIDNFLRSGSPLVNIAGVPGDSPRNNLFEKTRINAKLTTTQLATEADVSRATIEKMQNSEPVKAELAVRVCITLSRYLSEAVTYQSLDIKTTVRRKNQSS